MINNIYADMENQKKLTAKVFYSFKNHFILIPKNCQDILYYKPCIISEINRNL